MPAVKSLVAEAEGGCHSGRPRLACLPGRRSPYGEPKGQQLPRRRQIGLRGRDGKLSSALTRRSRSWGDASPAIGAVPAQTDWMGSESKRPGGLLGADFYKSDFGNSRNLRLYSYASSYQIVNGLWRLSLGAPLMVWRRVAPWVVYRRNRRYRFRMKVPTMMRLDQELIDRIEAYRIKTGIKSTAEATRRLIEAGLGVEVIVIDAAPGQVVSVPRGVAGPVTPGLWREPSGPVDTAGQPAASGYHVASLAEVEAERRSKSFLKPTKGKGK